MGVCSQDNLLWGDLTGPEHLRFFSRLRKIESGKMKHHINYWLRRVNLDKRYDRLKYSRSYSGGMKRRLGVANAFIGNPQLVYPDEPSTGSFTPGSFVWKEGMADWTVASEVDALHDVL